MISFAQPLPVGNAVRLLVVPPPGTERTRLLRRTADTFTGPDDAGALVVADDDIHAALDTVGLVNGVTYYYREYSFVGGVWVTGSTVTAVPEATYVDESVPVVEIVRERIAAALAVEIARGALIHEEGRIPVLTASPTFEGTKWPVVTIHVTNDADSQRWLGEMDAPDEFDAVADEWIASEGWLARVQLMIVGWALNPEVRAALRRAIKRIVIANLAVFDERGLLQVSLAQSDTEDFQSYAAPVYQSVAQFSCLARAAVSATESPISDVITTATAVDPGPIATVVVAPNP